jgi:hypothetical protein
VLGDITVVLVSVALAIVGFITLIVVCAVILRLIDVVLPTGERAPDGADAPGDAPADAPTEAKAEPPADDAAAG